MTWWAVSDDDLWDMFYRIQAGADPMDVYLDLHSNKKPKGAADRLLKEFKDDGWIPGKVAWRASRD
jgi:hypothetical protein